MPPFWPFICALGLVSAAVAQIQPSASSGAAEDIAAGADTFRSHCAACHGLRREGGRGPNLAVGIFYHGGTDTDLQKNIASGIAGTEMPGLFYSSDRISQVVLYIRSLARQTPQNLPGDIAAGQRLYGANGCVNCHRVAGEGGWLGPELSKIGGSRSPEFLRQSITDPNAHVEPGYWTANARLKDGRSLSGYVMGEDTYNLRLLAFDGKLQSVAKRELASYNLEKTSKMPSYRSRLNAKELDDLVAYLYSLKPESMRDVPSEAGER